MNARLVFIIFLVAVGYAFYSYREKTKSVSEPVVTLSPPIKKSEPVKKSVTVEMRAPSKPVIIAQPAAPAPPPPSAPNIPSQPPAPVSKEFKIPPNTLPFKVGEDGLAVAFGDILLGTPQGATTMGMHGVARPPALQFWESGEIPYHIQPNVPHPERIQEAFALFNQSPITFVPYSNQPDALVFEAKPGHCRSYLGRVGGLQPVWLSDNCGPAEIAHEIMHALGFIHEQSRTDRDEFIEVMWDNIEEDFKSQFVMIPQDLMLSTRGVSFDFESIMLYRPTAFAKKPDLPTMRSKTQDAITPATALSKRDLERLYKIYR